MQVRRSNIADISTVSCRLRSNVREVSLFQRTEREIGRNIVDLLVAEDKGRAVGCVALHKYKGGIAEIRALSVLGSSRNSGVGRMLIEECVGIAVSEKFDLLWLATAKPLYFEKSGFRPMSRWSLPRHILRKKLTLVFKQPVDRWLPALFGTHSFMRYSARQKQEEK